VATTDPGRPLPQVRCGGELEDGRRGLLCSPDRDGELKDGDHRRAGSERWRPQGRGRREEHRRWSIHGRAREEGWR
jgi:hypothetical protein